MKEPITRKVKHIAVARFYEIYRKSRELQLVNSPLGMSRLITQPAINRPGLALAGYFGYFAHERIQIFGNAEVAFLDTLSPEERRERLRKLFSYKTIPCIVFTRAALVPMDVLALADEHAICVFQTPQRTMHFANSATMLLENEFADNTSMHGCMVSVRGVGVLITGKCGIGKSEITLGLVERGAALVADDLVRISNINGELIATAPGLSRGFIEIRGLGIINVTSLFGLKAYSREIKLNLVINLSDGEMTEIERLGIDKRMINILGVDVQRLTLPVAPGRDMSRLVEIAALRAYLGDSGYDMASEFTKRLNQEIALRSMPAPPAPASPDPSPIA